MDLKEFCRSNPEPTQWLGFLASSSPLAQVTADLNKFMDSLQGKISSIFDMIATMRDPENPAPRDRYTLFSSCKPVVEFGMLCNYRDGHTGLQCIYGLGLYIWISFHKIPIPFYIYLGWPKSLMLFLPTWRNPSRCSQSAWRSWRWTRLRSLTPKIWSWWRSLAS